MLLKFDTTLCSPVFASYRRAPSHHLRAARFRREERVQRGSSDPRPGERSAGPLVREQGRVRFRTRSAFHVIFEVMDVHRER